MRKVTQENSSNIERYGAYVELYISFDSTIWQMPPFLIGAVTLLLGLAVALFENSGGAPAIVWGFVLTGSSFILLLGAYSIWRVRFHQNLLGNELRKIEAEGYFHERKRARERSRVPTTTTVYMYFFLICGCLLLLSGLGVFLGYSQLHRLLGIPGSYAIDC